MATVSPPGVRATAFPSNVINGSRVTGQRGGVWIATAGGLCQATRLDVQVPVAPDARSAERGARRS